MNGPPPREGKWVRQSFKDLADGRRRALGRPPHIASPFAARTGTWMELL